MLFYSFKLILFLDKIVLRHEIYKIWIDFKTIININCYHYIVIILWKYMNHSLDTEIELTSDLICGYAFLFGISVLFLLTSFDRICLTQQVVDQLKKIRSN